MRILYAASEALPYIASGGLADVAGSLPKAIRDKKHACRVVMPLYSDIKDELRADLKFITSFYVPVAWRSQYCGLFEGNINGVKYYLLDNEYYFKRKGIYGFYDDAERFAFFSRAILEMLKYIQFEPQIIHCNDWQTALVPVYLNMFYRSNEKYCDIKTVFTIHNIQYQGQYGRELLTDVLGIPEYASSILEYDNCVNFMKGAIDQSDMVTTVSPTYAREILDPWYSHKLDRMLVPRQYKLRGILNGIDINAYNPKTDTMIYENYDIDTVKTGKPKNKLALQREMGLPEDKDKMLVGMVTRLVAHKGLDLVKYIMEEMVAHGYQFVILGSGDREFEEYFSYMHEKYPSSVGLKIGFIPQLARKIYAGADAFLMPSKSEPCGLAQMISLRYGTLPIVRLTGGLQDSIRDLGGEDGNGFTFSSYNAHDMMGAVDRCAALFENKKKWNEAVVNAMKCDCSWAKSADEYIDMYKSLLK